MKSSDLDKLTTLSNISVKNSELVLTSTKIDFSKNAYVKELWKYSGDTWKKFKSSNSKSFLNALTSVIKNIFHILKLKKIKKENRN